jgi:hypothetical protein
VLEGYEAGLREVLARHGLDGKGGVASLRIRQMAVDPVTLLQVEFAARREAGLLNATAGGAGLGLVLIAM